MAAGAAAIAAVGCGDDDDDEESPTSAATTAAATSAATTAAATAAATTAASVKANITYWSVHPAGSKAVEEELIKRFEAKYPDIKVKLETAGANYAEVAQKFQAGLAAKQVPDVIMLSDVWWFKYFLAKTIVPMDDLVKTAGIDLTDYHDPLVKDYQYDGKLWGMPFARSTPLFYYNKDKWAAAGLPDRGPKTWDEMDEWGAKLMAKAATGEYAFTHVKGDSYIAWTFQGTIWQFGGRYSDDNFNMLVTSQESIDGGNYFRSQIFEKKYANVTSKDEKADFLAGTTASTISSTGGLTGVIRDAKFPVGVAFLPEKKAFGCPTGGAGLCIPTGLSKDNQTAAALFIGFVTNPENTAYYSQNVGYMPVRKSAASGPLMAEFYTKNPQFKVAVEQLAKTRSQDSARVYVPGGDSILGKGLERMVLNNEDAKNVWPDVKKELDSIVASEVKPKLKG